MTYGGPHDGVYFQLFVPLGVVYINSAEGPLMLMWSAQAAPTAGHEPYYYMETEFRKNPADPNGAQLPLYIYTHKPPSDNDGERVKVPQPAEPSHA